MKKHTLLLLAVLISANVYAKSMSSLDRGGYGFLYPDANSFANPGSLSLAQAFAIQAEYVRADKGGEVAGSPSVVWGNGKFGLGVFDSRVGTSLSQKNSYLDLIGAGLGLSFAQQKLTAGIGFSKILATGVTDKGQLNASLTWTANRGKGLGITVGGSTSLNAGSNPQTGQAAIGYSFKPNNSIDFGVTINDLKNSKDYTGNVDLTLGGQSLYFGAAFHYLALAKQNEVAARLGLILGGVFDLSAEAAKVIETGGIVTYGGTVRLAF